MKYDSRREAQLTMWAPAAVMAAVRPAPLNVRQYIKGGKVHISSGGKVNILSGEWSIY